MTAYVAYRRVSTSKQGASGLGLEAQEASIKTFAAVTGAQIVATFTDVESGSHDDRPELLAAIDHAKRVGATVLVATLDRLSRDVHFISGLMKRGVDFRCADMPGASTFELHIRAAIGEEERRKISIRTKAALAAARARGVKLGRKSSGAFADGVQAQGRAVAAVAVQSRVAEHVARVRPMIDALKDQGMSLNQIAKTLTRNGVATATGATTWQHGQVARVLAHAA